MENKTNGIALMSCPFCGGTAEQRVHDATGVAWVRCMSCGVTSNGGRASQAIEEWNARAEQTCHVAASSTDGLCSDNPRIHFKLSCGHSFTLDGLEMPNYCPKCGARIV